jgi:type II secretory pathway component GspD/PulD (secretin)/Spy/CpxP family protein refolding chaperone
VFSIHRMMIWVVMGNMILSLRNLRNICVLALLFMAASDWTLAQEPDPSTPSADRQSQDRGGRGRRGFGGRGFGITGELRNDATLQELGLTDEQKQKLDELNQSRRNMRESNPKLANLFSKMRDASDEERQLLQVEMQVEMTKAQGEAEAKVKEIIGDVKLTRLRQISYHRQGVSAVTQEAVSKELGLSDAQIEQINQLQDDQRSAFRELGFDASPEDRQKLTDEYRAKITAVLTPEQQTKWQGLIGPPPADTAAAGGTGPAAPAATTPPRVRRPPVVVEAPPGVTPEVSFGTEAKQTQKLKFSFRYAPWMDVLKLFAESANLSIDLNAVPPGTFSYYDTKEYSPTEALDILNGYLLPKGFVLVRRDEFLVCISIDEEIAPNLVPVIGADELAKRGKNELLTVVFPLEGVDVEQIAKEIEQVKGPQGKVVGMKTTNSLMVTDIGTNLLRIQSLLTGATRGGPNDMVFKPYSMKHLPATEAEQVLRGLLGLQVAATNVSGDNRTTGQRGFGFGPPPSTPAPARTAKSSTQITADTRTNSLLVSATSAEHQLIEEALKAIDVEAEDGGTTGAGKPFLRVYKIKSADTREVTKTIDALMPGVVVNEDNSVRAISIFATEKQHSEVDTLIRQLDGGGGAEQVAVIPLGKMDVSVAVSTLQSMFIRDGSTAPTIQADVLGRQVMVRGSADQLAQVKTLLAELGEDGSGRKKGSDAGTFRRYPISGRDPEELIPLIERMWGTASPNPIRIVTPGQRGQGENNSGSIKGIKRPEREAREAPQPPPANKPSASLNYKGRTAARAPSIRVQTTGLTTDELMEDDEAAESTETPAAKPPAASEADEDAQLEQLLRDSGAVQSAPPAEDNSSAPADDKPAPSNSESPVIITVLGDELLLTSQDSAALDQLEELLAKTMEVLPPRLQWTVYTLQSADATEVATMLQQLIPESSVTSSSSSSGGFGALGGGVSSFGSSLMGMTGIGNMAANPQTLQIIPELRLNALFVAGPTSKVREVEEILKVLDSSELPDNLRNKSSHIVQLEYADAQEVYDVLKDVYKGYLEDGNANPQANALAMLMGGGRGRNDANQKPKVQLALGIDKRTNQIIIWGDENLSQEIEALALNLDESAQAAKRTVRVLSLQNTNSSVVTSALGQLMPKVKVSSSGPRTSTSSGSGSGTSPGTTSSGGNTPAAQQNQDQQMRDLFRQRMMEGGGGQNGFGGGRGNPFGGGNSGNNNGGGSRGQFGGGNRGRGMRGN